MTAGQDSIFQEVLYFRRHLHQHPELSGREEKTAAFLKGLLEEWGLEVSASSTGYGLVAVLRGTSTGPTVALRCDMDALPVEEETGLDFASQNRGVMHACGHDVHMAVTLGVAKYFSKRRSDLRGTVKFIFEPEEETNRGAQKMIDSGCLDNPRPDVIIGFHVSPEYKVGTIALSAGPVMAAESNFEVTILGEGSHGSQPHKGKDAIAAAASFVSNLYAALHRRMDAMSPSAVTVGCIQGGRAPNIVADCVHLKGTARSFLEEADKKIQEIICDTAEGVKRLFDVDWQFLYRREIPPLVNDEASVMVGRNILEESLGQQLIVPANPMMASEDFSLYLKKIAGLFFFLGVSSGEETSYPLHHPRFKIDESSMGVALKALIALTEGFLRR
ncbi:M20 family metallopeptidase [Moorellaceae bacterium AZ2]